MRGDMREEWASRLRKVVKEMNKEGGDRSWVSFRPRRTSHGGRAAELTSIWHRARPEFLNTDATEEKMQTLFHRSIEASETEKNIDNRRVRAHCTAIPFLPLLQNSKNEAAENKGKNSNTQHTRTERYGPPRRMAPLH